MGLTVTLMPEYGFKQSVDTTRHIEINNVTYAVIGFDKIILGMKSSSNMLVTSELRKNDLTIQRGSGIVDIFKSAKSDFLPYYTKEGSLIFVNDISVKRRGLLSRLTLKKKRIYFIDGTSTPLLNIESKPVRLLKALKIALRFSKAQRRLACKNGLGRYNQYACNPIYKPSL